MILTHTTPLPRAAAFLLLSALGAAQAPANAPERSAGELAALAAVRDFSHATGSGYLAGLERKVYFDERGDHSIWAVGETYKAGFDAGGATYIPFFGSWAPGSFPVHLEITEILAGGRPLGFDPSAQPVLQGERVVFDRGSLLETYDLRVDSVEQLFVFETPTGPGDLVVRIAVDSALTRGRDDAALILAGECGSVRYSSAVAVDARGVRTSAPTCWKDGSIEIRVPAEALSQVRWPLVIDPLVTTFWIDSGTTDDLTPDVAYDLTTGDYCIVFERAFSAADHDVVSRRVDSSGNAVGAALVDGGPGYWARPKVANSNAGDQFLIVAEVGDPSGGARTIGGRTQNALNGFIGPQLVFTTGMSGDNIRPDVGGDSRLVSSPPPFYCVVWERVLSSTNHDIHYRVMQPDLQSTGILNLDTSTSTLDEAPSISKSDGKFVLGSTAQAWNVVWTRAVSGLDHDLYGARILFNGIVGSSTFPIDTTSANTISPSPTSPTSDASRRWMVAYTTANLLSGSYETWGKLLEGSTTVDTADLTQLSGATTTEDQTNPSADCDGSLFVVANSETETATPGTRRIKIATFSALGSTIALAEGSVAMPTGSDNDQAEVTTTASAGGSIHRTMLAWRIVLSAGDGHMIGALYDADPFTVFCAPGTDGVLACPCGNAPALQARGCNNSNNTGGGYLTPQGGVSPDTVTLSAGGMRPSATCIFLQGNGLVPAGAAFGDGVRCAGGLLTRLYLKTATSLGGALAPDAGAADPTITARSAALGDTILPGSKRWYQTYYRDPVDYACGAPSTFNITTGVQIDW